jgi:hypothetical protein
MKKNIKYQLSFDADIYSQPDVDIHKQDSPGQKPTKAKRSRKVKEPAQTSQQAFLPGLSRRGRPRSANPVSPSVRASESRKRRMEVGVKRIELLLEPAVASDLDALVEYFKVSRAEVIGRLISKAAKRLRNP